MSSSQTELIDLHFHALPGIDDGPADMAQAVALCRAAAEAGTSTVYATPHHRHPLWPNDDLIALEALLAELQEAVGPAPRLRLGAEIRVDSQLLDDLDRLGRMGSPTLGSSRYLLLEFARGGRPDIDAGSLVHELRVAGWVPIVAHPEFIPWLVESPATAVELVERGALLQVTAMSIVGDFGRGPAIVCRGMLEAGIVHFVASDAHSLERRPPGLRRAFEEVRERFGEDTAEQIFRRNPAAVEADRLLDQSPE